MEETLYNIVLNAFSGEMLLVFVAFIATSIFVLYVKNFMLRVVNYLNFKFNPYVSIGREVVVNEYYKGVIEKVGLYNVIIKTENGTLLISTQRLPYFTIEFIDRMKKV